MARDAPSPNAQGSDDSRLGRVYRWWLRQLPGPGELAVATVVGALAVALSNAVAIALSVPTPVGGIRLRLLHHAFDFGQVVGLGVVLALPFVLVARLARTRLGRRLPRWLGWSILWLVATVANGWLLASRLEREALCVADGQFAPVLYPLYLVLCGAAIPACYLLAALCGRHRVVAWLGSGVALGGMVVGHVVWRDDYPGVHTVIAWVSCCGFGGAWAPRLMAWWGKDGPRRRGRVVGFVAAFVAVVALLWPPPNRVRRELFREPGAVVAWLLARTWWTTPQVPPPASSPAPTKARPAGQRPPSFPRRPVVVLISIEAFRGDVLADSAHDELLPVLARLRDTGAYFERASSAGSQTSVSLTSLFTSRYYSQLLWKPYGEGCSRFFYAAEDPSTRFPALLSTAGVETSSFLGLIFLASRFGVARGFTHEQLVVEGRVHASAAAVMNPLLARLRQAHDEPHFVYAHLMEPHEPYDRGKLREGPPWECYLSEVAVVDAWLGRLVRLLKRRFPRRGYLIITGDHGEAFGEHGTRFHTKTLYEELLHVPLVIWGPGISAKRYQERVGFVDLGPTVVELFGQPVPPAFMGQSLWPLLHGEVQQLERPLLAEGRLRRVLYSRDGLKVIEDTRRKVVEAYDLDRDPSELHDVFDSEPERARAALGRLQAFFAAHTRRDPPGYTPPFKP